MKKLNYYLAAVLFLFVLLQSCASAKYIHDEESKQRQTELVKDRSGNVVSDVVVSLASVIFSSAFDSDVVISPEEKSYKKLKLLNKTGDIMYVNMLTDVLWDENTYCDFTDIRIPPHKKYKLLVPLNATYNLYFSTTPESDDDEMIEIYTSQQRKIKLYPGLTKTFDITN